MTFLIPAEMQVGNFPSDELLNRFNLSQEFKGIRDSVLNGDIKSLEEHLDENMPIFI